MDEMHTVFWVYLVESLLGVYWGWIDTYLLILYIISITIIAFETIDFIQQSGLGRAGRRQLARPRKSARTSGLGWIVE